jgi:hypothetical protein
MSDDPTTSVANAQDDSEPTANAAQAAETLSAFESRILAGEFDSGGFHRAVQHELYPLLGEGALEPAAFARLVDLWAQRNHPFDWPLKPYGSPD